MKGNKCRTILWNIINVLNSAHLFSKLYEEHCIKWVNFCSDRESHIRGNLASHSEKSHNQNLRKKSSNHSSAVRTAILEVENTLASSNDALKTVSAAYGSPIIIPQTATVQPLQQLQQSNTVLTSKDTRTSVSSPSPTSSASSSATPARKFFNRITVLQRIK